MLSSNELSTVKKKVGNDPRFDTLAGRLSEEHHNRAYAFLDDYKRTGNLLLTSLVEISYLVYRNCSSSEGSRKAKKRTGENGL